MNRFGLSLSALGRGLLSRSSRGDEALISWLAYGLWGFFANLGLWTFSFRLARRRHRPAARVYSLMKRRPAQRIRALNKYPLDKFVIEKPLAIHELIEHPRRNLLRLRFNLPSLGLRTPYLRFGD